MRASNSLVIGGGVVGTASFISSCVWAQDIVRCSYHITVSSGTCVGTFTIQGSNDIPVGANYHQFTPTNWTSIGSSSTLVCSATASIKTFMIPSFESCYEYQRVQFTALNGGAGLGTVDIRMKALGI